MSRRRVLDTLVIVVQAKCSNSIFFETGQMFQIPCGKCDANVEVTAAKAGGEVSCSSCEGIISVPKLGELRANYAVASPSSDSSQTGRQSPGATTPKGSSLVFAVSASLAVVCLLGAAFCFINSWSIEVPLNTQTHIDVLKSNYQEITSAQLVRQFEDITEYGVDVDSPLLYRQVEKTKESWTNRGQVFGICMIVLVGVAGFSGRSGR